MGHSSGSPEVVTDAHSMKIYMVQPGEVFDNENSAPHDRLVDNTSQLPPAQASTSIRRATSALHGWALEITSLAIAAGFMAAIWAVIARYDGQPLPEWPINLSTIVSLLTVGLRLAIITPVSVIISQQKWLWMSRCPRPLLDLQRMDSASNSVLGATELLLRGPRSPVAMLSSAVLVLALAMGPIAQQAIRMLPCERPVVGISASVPVANYMDGKTRRYGSGLFDLAEKEKGPLLSGLVNPLGNDTAVAASCSTGECRFEEHGGVTYISVGLCHSCIDTSSLFTANPIANDSTQGWAWPTGATIDYGHRVIGGPSNYSILDQKLFSPEFVVAFSEGVGAVNILVSTNASCSESPAYTSCNKSREGLRPLGVDCALYPCVQRFHGRVHAGQLEERVVSTSQMFRKMTVPNERSPYPNYTALEIPCIIENKLYDTSNFCTLDRSKYSFMDVMVDGKVTSAPYECVYILDGVYVRGLSDPLCRGNAEEGDGCLFMGTCMVSVSTPGVRCRVPFWLERLWGTGSANLTTVSSVMAQFATAVSSHFRRTGSSLYRSPTASNQDKPAGVRRPALGTVYANTLCVSFAWPWLIWPLVLYVVAAALLVGAVLRPYLYRDQPIWKSSSLPLLFYTMEEPVLVGGLRDEKQLEEKAKNMKVQFVREEGQGLVRPV